MKNAVAFAKWILESEYVPLDKEELWYNPENTYTTEELYELFKVRICQKTSK